MKFRFFIALAISFFSLESRCQELETIKVTETFSDFLNNFNGLDSNVFFIFSYKDMTLIRKIERGSNVVISPNSQTERDTTFTVNFIGLKDSLKGVSFTTAIFNDEINQIKHSATRSESVQIENALNFPIAKLFDSLQFLKIVSENYIDSSKKNETYKFWDKTLDSSNQYILLSLEYNRTNVSSNIFLSKDIDKNYFGRLKKIVLSVFLGKDFEKKTNMKSITISTQMQKVYLNDEAGIKKIFDHFEKILKTRSPDFN